MLTSVLTYKRGKLNASEAEAIDQALQHFQKVGLIPCPTLSADVQINKLSQELLVDAIMAKGRKNAHRTIWPTFWPDIGEQMSPAVTPKVTFSKRDTGMASQVGKGESAADVRSESS